MRSNINWSRRRVNGVRRGSVVTLGGFDHDESDMPSSQKVRVRIAERVSKLCGSFSESLARFEEAGQFTGPSLYFHHKTVARRLAIGDVSELVEDEQFFDFLYATLTAWGMHRMGPGNTKLEDIDSIKSSFKSQADAIRALDGSTLGVSPESEVPEVARAIWRIVESLNVSVAEARIVANSKALHHVLPNLVPPIDREYTFRFFYGRNNLSIDESEAFQEMYVELDRIARSNLGAIRKYIGHGWHTGHAKVVDNAIVGYMINQRGTA